METDIRRQLESERGGDPILGEEFGGATTFSGRQWVIDPIDGTKNFVRGVPVWATLIALLHDGVPVAGVVSAPALQRRWWAADGQGAFVAVAGQAPRPLSVSKVAELESASLSFSSLSGWAKRGLRDRFIDLTDTVWRVRGFGDFFSYCLLAEGAVDIAAEPEVSLWDLAALDILVRESGGTFTNLDGVAARTAAASSPPTGCCTTRRCPASRASRAENRRMGGTASRTTTSDVGDQLVGAGRAHQALQPAGRLHCQGGM